jgi:hypothetical protein
MNQISKFVKSKGLMNSIVVVLLIVPLYVTSVFSIFSYINLRSNPEQEIDTAILEDILSENDIEEDPFSQDEYQNEELESDNMDVLPETGGSIKLNSVKAKCVNGTIQATVSYKSEVKGGKFKIRVVNLNKTFASKSTKTTISFKSDQYSFKVNVYNGKVVSNTLSFNIQKCTSLINTQIKKPIIKTKTISISLKSVFYKEKSQIYITCENNRSGQILDSKKFSITIKNLDTNDLITKQFAPYGEDIIKRVWVYSYEDFKLPIEKGRRYAVTCKDITNNITSNTAYIVGSSSKPYLSNTPKPTKLVIKTPTIPTMYCDVDNSLKQDKKVCIYAGYDKTAGGYKLNAQLAPKKSYICKSYYKTTTVLYGQKKDGYVFYNCN